MNHAFISIGSNIGERSRHLKNAVRALHLQEGIVVLSVSSIYETAPVGFTDQSDFFNIVIEVSTTLSPHQLLGVCQKIEHDLGRIRTLRWGPRIVDLDILLYNSDNITTDNLIVPHPRMHERAFVLIPLLEISPEAADPVTGQQYKEAKAVHDEGVLLQQKLSGVKDFIK